MTSRTRWYIDDRPDGDQREPCSICGDPWDGIPEYDYQAETVCNRCIDQCNSFEFDIVAKFADEQADEIRQLRAQVARLQAALARTIGTEEITTTR